MLKAVAAWPFHFQPISSQCLQARVKTSVSQQESSDCQEVFVKCARLTQGNFAEVGVTALNSWRLEFDGSLNLPEEKRDTKQGFWNTPKVW